MWPFSKSSLPSDPDEAFGDAVRKEFGSLARECGASLVQTESMIFGFATQFAVLTIGAYPGHFRGICVKLRSREAGESVSVKDGTDIGLANVEAMITGQVSATHNKRQRWTAGEIREEIEGLAAITRRVAMPFLTTPQGNWRGLRAFVDEKIEKAPKPWRSLLEGKG
jgi:hypothetical protein